jgi:DNA repair protein RadD
MSFSLRPYQQEAVEAVWNHLRTRDDNPCVVLPTGTGKSLVIAQIATDAVSRWHGRVVVLAHVKELLEQNAEKIRKLCPNLKIGIYSAGLKSRDTKEDVIVAGIQSVHKRACELGAFDIAIIDEAHLIPPDGEGMYREFLKDAKVVNPHIRLIGLTATPFRLRGGLICKPENMLNYVCYEAGLKEMIVQGYLSPLIPKSGSYVSSIDFESLHIRAGEFVADEVEVLMNNEKLVANACYEIVQLTKDRNAVLIFGVSISHCKKIKKYIEEYSHEECAIVTGDTPAGERATILDRIKGVEVAADLFGNKMPRLKYLVNVSVLTTGFDAPNIDCIAILRPTASAGLLLQMVGRGLRLSPATEKVNCLVLDYGNNILRHGPLDAIRVEEKEHKARQNGEKPAKKCPQCNALIETARTICQYCGYVFPPKELKHDETASEDGLLTGQVIVHDETVSRVNYIKWVKKDANQTKPPTLCIEYEIGFNKYFREWICPEHTGYARQKFEKWWEEHKVVPFDPVPDTVDEAIEMANNGILKYPVKITIRHVSGEKFDRICNYEYGDPPETQYQSTCSKEDEEVLLGVAADDDGSDIPF